MNQSVINTLNSSEMLEARRYHLDRLERLYAGEKLDTPFFLSGYSGRGAADPLRDSEKWVEKSLTDLYEHADLICDKQVFRPLCSQFRFWGVHFTDRVFGAPTKIQGGQV